MILPVPIAAAAAQAATPAPAVLPQGPALAARRASGVKGEAE